MQDRPTALELLRAAQEFCEKDLGPQLTGRLRFHTRVLQNVLGILEREWEAEESAARAEWGRLQTLLSTGQEVPASFKELSASVREANRSLAQQIRSGALDESLDQVADTLYETVGEKLDIANPNHR
ncbi:MAG: DUF6285 domain-containing protein [Vicinamibacteria bacterium]